MHRPTLAALSAAWLVAAACSSPAPTARPEAATPADTTGAAPASFVNRVWSVAESPQVAQGEQRVFLAEGTLVMSSPNGMPAFGTWQVKEGGLVITEEGRDYPVDVLELTPTTFRIRMRGPGEPVVIRFAPAEQPAIPLNPPAQP